MFPRGRPPSPAEARFFFLTDVGFRFVIACLLRLAMWDVCEVMPVLELEPEIRTYRRKSVLAEVVKLPD